MAKQRFSVFHQAIYKQYLFLHSKRLMVCRDIFTYLMTFDLNDKSLLHVPELLSAPVVTVEVLLTHFKKCSDCKFNL